MSVAPEARVSSVEPAGDALLDPRSAETSPPSGDADSLDTATLFRRHGAFVARFLTRLGVAPVDLDDVLQEVFLVVHARGGYSPGPAKPTSYLGAIATRAASTYRRRRGASQLRASMVLPDELTTSEPDAMLTLQRGESARALQVALASLDPTLCATLLLVDQEGESCGSVAASMGAAVGTVYWRLHKARKSLRNALNEQQKQAEANGAAEARRAKPSVPRGARHVDARGTGEPHKELL